MDICSLPNTAVTPRRWIADVDQALGAGADRLSGIAGRVDDGCHLLQSQLYRCEPQRSSPFLLLKACLDLMVNRRIAREDGKRRYSLVKPDLTRDQLALAGQSYRERAEQARLRQQRMIDYAEGNTCRWERILEYFDSDELATTACAHCDCCPSRDKLRLRNVS